MPADIHEEWLLIEEFVLFEGDRALLKLLRCGWRWLAAAQNLPSTIMLLARSALCHQALIRNDKQRRELDKFCQSVASCKDERLRSGTSITAQALHMRQRAYNALQGGQIQRDNDGADAHAPARSPGLQHQPVGGQQSERETSASGRRARMASPGQVSSLQSALEEARSHSLRASNSPELESAVEHGNDRQDENSVRTDAASVDACQPDAPATAHGGPPSTLQRPEAALMAARKLVGHAIFGLEVCRSARQRDDLIRGARRLDHPCHWLLVPRSPHMYNN